MTHNQANKLFSGVILLTALSMPSLSFAHAKMVRSSPEENAVLTESPKQVDVWFDDKVGTEYKALAVINSKGERVDNKDMVQSSDLAHFYVTVPVLTPDTYTVRYRAVSIDTHIVTGKYPFTIKTP
ncbi:MAG: copper resistance protein CopC [Methylococcales bacterium]|nr:copper resistance protein CopC [Methylococcales bacterium]